MRIISLPKLLNDSGGIAREIHPNRVSINMNIIPLSDASMELPQEESLPARGYVELFTCLGSAGIFRVCSPQDSYGTVSTNADLEHAIVEVGDYLVTGVYNEMMEASTAMQTIFEYYRGTKWQLGSVSALGTTQVAVTIKYERVLDAMLKILEQKPECMMAFDFSTTPWTVNIVARDSIVTAECRLARNTNYAKVTYDDTELCTRAYYEIPSTKDADISNFPVFDQEQNYTKDSFVAHENKLYQLTNGHVKGVAWQNTTKTQVNNSPATAWIYKDADTIGTYGIVERNVSTGSNYTLEEATRVVDEYLRTHKNPRVSVEISADELSEATGETFDRFALGKLCRLALSDYGVTVDKTITSMYWSDVYGMPEDITVNLADEEDTVLNFLHDLDSKGGGGGGGGAQIEQEETFKEFWTKFETDDFHFGLHAIRMKNLEEILSKAGLYIDNEGVLIYAENVENSIGTKFQVQADKIGMVVGTYDEGGNYIKAGDIVLAINSTTGASTATIDANHINISATDTVATLAGVMYKDLAGKLILKNAGGIYVQRTNAGITSEFGVWDEGNLTAGVLVKKLSDGSTVTKIKSDYIDFEGFVTASYIASKIASVDNLNVNDISAQGSVFVEDGVDTYYLNAADAQITSLKIGGSSAAAITDSTKIVVGATKSTDGKTLTLTFADGTTLPFDKSGGASPTGTVTLGSRIEDQTYRCNILMSGGASSITGSIDCEQVYNAGYNAGWIAARASISYRDATYLDVYIPSATVDGTPEVGYSFRPSIPEFSQTWGPDELHVTATSKVQIINRKGGSTDWSTTNISRRGDKYYDIG